MLKPMLENLRKQINIIVANELSPLMETQETIKCLIKEIEKRPHVDSLELFDSVKYCYGAASISAICRQTDQDKQSESLVVLLNKLSTNFGYFTKAWFLEECRNIVPPRPFHADVDDAGLESCRKD